MQLSSEYWNKLKTPTPQGFYSRYFRHVLCLETDPPRKNIEKTSRLSSTAKVGGCEKRLYIYILASSRFAVMFFRCILGRSWESLCGIINVGKKTELSGNWDRSFYRFSTFFSLPVFDSARFICSQLEPVRPPLTLFFYLENSFSSFVILVWS